MQGTQVRSLIQEDPLEEGMVTHSSIPTWRILWTEVPGGLTESWTRLSSTHQHWGVYRRLETLSAHLPAFSLPEAGQIPFLVHHAFSIPS